MAGLALQRAGAFRPGPLRSFGAEQSKRPFWMVLCYSFGISLAEAGHDGFGLGHRDWHLDLADGDRAGATVEEDHLVRRAAAQVGVASDDSVLLRPRLVPLLLRLRSLRFHGRDDLFLKGFLHPAPDGPPGEPERRAENRAADVLKGVVADVEVIPSLVTAPTSA